MGLIARMRKQKAVWWAVTGWDNGGRPRFAEPVEIDCRWEEKAEEFIDAEKVRRVSSSVVYVDRKVLPGYLCLSELADLDTSIKFEPLKNPAAFKVQGYSEIPKLRLTETLRIAYL